MHFSKVKKFVSIVVNKNVDIDDIKQCNDYSDYIEYVGMFNESGMFEPENLLEEKEFDLCKEVIKEYAK